MRRTDLVSAPTGQVQGWEQINKQTNKQNKIHSGDKGYGENKASYKAGERWDVAGEGHSGTLGRVVREGQAR